MDDVKLESFDGLESLPKPILRKGVKAVVERILMASVPTDQKKENRVDLSARELRLVPQSVIQSTVLVELNISGNLLDPKAAPLLASVVKSNLNLESLE